MDRWLASIVAGQVADGQARGRTGQADRAAETRSRRHGRRRLGAPSRRRVEPTNRIGRALVLLVPGLLAAAAPPSTAARAAVADPDRVAVRAAPHPGYGRLVFDWPGPIEFERTDADGAVIVRFARPFAADLSAVPERLGDYLRDIERTGDGRGVRLHLPADVRARLSHFDPDLVVVDLERDAGTAADDAGVTVRTGEHEGFTRIVFDWPGPVTFKQQRDGRDLTLEFDRAAQVDVVALGRRLQPWLEELTAGSDAQGTRVRLRLGPGLDARAFTVEETRVVVDLLESGRGTAEARAADQAADVPATPPRTVASPSVQGDDPAAARRGPGATGLGGVPPDAGPTATATGETEPVPLEIDTTPRDDGIVLTFTWERPVPAAVFIRGGHLWTVFGAPVPAGADLPPALGPGADAHLGPAEVLGLGGGTALRFPLSRTADAAVARDGPAWQVTLRDQAAEPRPVPLERFGEPPRLRLRAGAGGRVLHLVDPAVGDRLSIWPLLEPGRGQPSARRLVELELIESAQGVVWRPLADRLEVELAERGVEFDAPGGLFLSSPATARAAGADREDENRAPSRDGNAQASAQPSEAPADDLPQPPADLAAEGTTDRAAREAVRDGPASTGASSSAEPYPAAVLGPPRRAAPGARGRGARRPRLRPGASRPLLPGADARARDARGAAPPG